jgi:spore coat polysaccharide biosynthesis protein SpsF (cytidylyltransferase family)
MLPLPTGRTVIGEVLTRCKRITGVDEVICAIPYLDDAELGKEAEKYCRVVCGPEDDVLARYMIAAGDTIESEGFDHIMRITGDCPLICPELCSAVLALHLREDAPYTSNICPRTFPRGLDCEVFTREMLEWADEWGDEPSDREHVTPLMQECGGPCIMSPWPIEGHLCIDTAEDYKVICKALEP